MNKYPTFFRKKYPTFFRKKYPTYFRNKYPTFFRKKYPTFFVDSLQNCPRWPDVKTFNLLNCKLTKISLTNNWTFSFFLTVHEGSASPF